jgi:uncharacterized protein YwgA
MDRRQISTKLCLDVLGVQLDLSAFNQRLVLQKTVYLLQASGLDLGYFFSWYLRGPYCSSLAADLFSAEEEIRSGVNDSKDWRLAESLSSSLDTTRGLLQAEDDSKDLPGRSKRLELLASLHFLIQRKGMSCEDPKRLMGVLHEYEKPYTLEEIKGGLRQLERHKLI